MAFSYNIEKSDDLTLLTMQGRLVDKVEAIELSVDIEEELEEGSNRFIVDLSKLEYMNSTGLNILINIMNKTRNEGGEAIIVGATPRVLSLFTVTKLDTVFSMRATREEASLFFSEQH